MRRLLFGLLILLSTALCVRADDQMSAVQTELKNQGFYYGTVDGQPGAETTAAIRRFQIRNGLEVTGQLNRETLASLKIGGGPQPGVAKRNQRETNPPVEPRETESDRNFLRREQTVERDETVRREETYTREPLAPQDRRPLPPTIPEVEPPTTFGDTNFADVFAQTPYATAPLEVQQQTLQAAQSRLGRGGYYRAPADGLPGPETTQALLRFQARSHLPATGRLDLDTLAQLGLLPNRRYAPRSVPPAPRAYRGIWIR